MSKEKKAVTKKAVTKKAATKKSTGGAIDKSSLCLSCTRVHTEQCKHKATPSVIERGGPLVCSAYTTEPIQALPPHEAALTPEVMPKGDEPQTGVLPADSAQIVKHQADLPVLASLESSIKRDIQLASKVDKAGAMIGIKIGLALDAAKRMIGYGYYEAWMQSKFGDIFSRRKGFYYMKLAQKFQLSQQYRGLVLPEKSELGNYLAVSDEQSDLGSAVSSFVGDMSINELMDKHGIKSKLKGGWHPADRDVEEFVRDYPELKGKDFDTWAEADRERFKSWLDKAQSGDMDMAKRLNAEGYWGKLTIEIMSKGMTEKSWSVIDTKMLTELHHALGALHREIGKAIRDS